MNELHRDLAALAMNRTGDASVPGDVGVVGHLAREGKQQTGARRTEPAGDDQSHTAFGALGVVGGQFVGVPQAVLEPGVHRAHDQTVGQGDAAELQWFEQARVMGIGLCGWG